jgi:N-methylhydantoinase A/oxoprolinase/acetone carboxylase beta subunit
VVVPRVAAVLSAWGMLATDLRFEVSRTHIGDTARLDGAGIKRLFAGMEQEGLARLRASFDGPVRVQRSVEMRYGEQIFEITVPLEGIDWEVDDPLPQIVERFHDRHEERRPTRCASRAGAGNARGGIGAAWRAAGACTRQAPMRHRAGSVARGCAGGPACRCSSSMIWHLVRRSPDRRLLNRR